MQYPKDDAIYVETFEEKDCERKNYEHTKLNKIYHFARAY